MHDCAFNGEAIIIDDDENRSFLSGPVDFNDRTLNVDNFPFQRFQVRKISAPSFAASLKPNLRSSSPASASATAASTPPSTPATSRDQSEAGSPRVRSRWRGRLKIDTAKASRRAAADDIEAAAAADNDGDTSASPPVFYGASDGQQTSSSSVLNTPLIQVTNMDEAVNFIDELKDKFRAQGQQIITYRRKLRQQVRILRRRRANEKFHA